MCGYHCWGMGFHGFFLVVLIVLLIWFLTRRHYYYGQYRRWGGNSALDILNERYAKGEISKEEYDEKKKDLLK